MNDKTKVVKGREVKKTEPENVKEEAAENPQNPSKESTHLKPTKQKGVVQGFTGSGGAGGAGSMNVEKSESTKN